MDVSQDVDEPGRLFKDVAASLYGNLSTNFYSNADTEISPISRLPTELLVTIFFTLMERHFPSAIESSDQEPLINLEEATPHSVRHILGLVCKEWRITVISIPLLWSLLSLRGERLPDYSLVEGWILRSKATTLQVYFHPSSSPSWSPQDVSRFRSLLKKNMHRIGLLLMPGSYSTNSFYFEELFFDDKHDSLSAPRLHTLCLSSRRWSGDLFRNSFTPVEFPELQRIFNKGPYSFLHNLNPAILSSLTTLRIVLTQLRVLRNILDLMNFCVGLKHLTLIAGRLSAPGSSSIIDDELSFPNNITLPRLQFIGIPYMCLKWLPNFLPHIRAPTLKTLSFDLSGTFPPQGWELELGLIPFLQQSMPFLDTLVVERIFDKRWDMDSIFSALPSLGILHIRSSHVSPFLFRSLIDPQGKRSLMVCPNLIKVMLHDCTFESHTIADLLRARRRVSDGQIRHLRPLELLGVTNSRVFDGNDNLIALAEGSEGVLVLNEGSL